MRSLGIASVILCQKQVKAKRDDVINPQNFNFI